MKLQANRTAPLLLSTAVAILMGTLGAVNSAAQVSAVTLPNGVVAFSSAILNEDAANTPASATDGFVSVTLTGVAPGTSITNKTYTGWCGAWYSSVLENFGDNGFRLYSTYAPLLPPPGNNPLVPGNNFNMVNYILNHKQGTVKDVQNAIWLIITGVGEAPSATAAAMAAEAALHADYIPSGPGAIMALFYSIGPDHLANNSVVAANHLQSLLLEIEVPHSPYDNDPLTLVCPNGSGQAGAPYAGSFGGTGVGPLAFSLIGSLPTGLTLDPLTGAITGIPTASGTFSFTGQLSGPSGAPVTAGCSITITPPPVPLSLVCPATPTGQLGVAYNSGLVASGGTGRYVYSIQSGTLPSGLTLDPATGFISGIPLVSGAGSYTAQVTDSGDSALAPVSTNCNITVRKAPTASCVVISATQGMAIVPATLSGSLGSGGPYTFEATGLPAGLVMSTSGQITGTPTVSGTFAYTVTVFDAAGNPGVITCSVTVAPPPPPLDVVCPSSVGQIGASYVSALTATGGTGNYAFSIVSGSLPYGLTLNPATGAITGRPTSGSSFTFTAKVTDLGAPSNTPDTSVCGISLTGAPTSTCLKISATQGKAMTPVTLRGLSGGGAPYSFSSANLPAGLTLSPAGQISGIPTLSGTFTYTVRITDKNGNPGTFTCSITICAAPAALSLVCPKSSGQIGAAYNSAVDANGGSGHYSYSISSGSLAPGLTLNAVTGYISGTPTGPGTFSFTAKAVDTSDQNLAPATRTCGISIAAAPSAACPVISATKGLAITPVTLRGLYGSGGPYSFSATGLPAGLTLSSYGRISGVPTAPGTFQYTIRITDDSGKSGVITCSITVAAPVPSLTPGISLTKSANKNRVNPFEKVTYTYLVKNTGTVALTNITVVDDNATPGFLTDDFTVGVIPSLAAGASVTLTASIYPPVREDADTDNDDWGYGGWGYRDWDNDYNKYDGGSMIVKELPNGDISFTYRVDKSLSDTTYGRNSSSGWGYGGRSFQGVANYEGAQFQILDKMGNVCLDFVADYISPSSNHRSGYGNLGIKGGGGMIYKGNAAHVLSVDSSLSKNMNRQSKYNKSTSDSPREGTLDWEDEQTYTVVVSKAACAKYGFGGVKVPKVKNYKSKRQNCESHVAHPASSVATNKATATVVYNGTTIRASDTATVTVDASSRNWSQCSKY